MILLDPDLEPDPALTGGYPMFQLCRPIKAWNQGMESAHQPRHDSVEVHQKTGTPNTPLLIHTVVVPGVDFVVALQRGRTNQPQKTVTPSPRRASQQP